jgi:hypothetical protein
MVKLRSLRRELRKAFGPEVADLVEQHEVRIRAHAAILRRGFFGRLKWLFLGR